ncbi:acyl-CoA dehydrogenase [Nitzschia inconspicua]|uniref:Acyl-CoA dehydrogenase n=1 Tax=Nitzschia inconspicua TaxID=303405 RepID=A0A9K3KCB1_9STRA|nr:acyl-CoA dehydrogenase [Nitzschia inconspicua]
MQQTEPPLQPSLTYLRPEVQALKERLDTFIEREVIPCERLYHDHMHSRHGNERWTMDALPPCLATLQQRAQSLGLWNLFLPPRLLQHISTSSNIPNQWLPKIPLSYREYGILAESMGKSELGAMACNCSAPDTGNMEVLLEFGTPQQQQEYLLPLLQGKIRSTFLMTEPDVASSDPTNLQTSLRKIERNGQMISYELTGKKWWSTGAMDPRCRVGICVAKMETETATSSSLHGKHTIVLVPLPHPNVKLVRPLTVFGYDDAPFGHAQVELCNVPLSAEHLIGGEGSGFQVSQARLGPGRIHHCMRAVGMAQRCYDLMLERSLSRKTFGKQLSEHGSLQRDIADSFSDLQAARLLTLHCAHQMDLYGPKQSRHYISSIKVAVPHLVMQILDRALQSYGGAGVCQDTVIASAWANMRTLRIADGPDEVHRRTVARLEINNTKKKMTARNGDQQGKQEQHNYDFTSRL